MIDKFEFNKVLIVGLGSIGKRHARLLRDLYPKIEIIALRRESSKPIDLHVFGVDKVVFSIDQAIASEPDFAIIANPSSLHLKVSSALLASNIHLLIEKPMTSSMRDARKLADLSIKSKSKVMIGYNLRFEPSLIALKKVLDSGKVGEVFSIRAEVGQNLLDWRPNSDYKKDVSANKLLGGGVLLELSHELDYLCWLFGNPDWISAFKDTRSNLQIDVEDLALIHMGFLFEQGGTRRETFCSLNMDFIRHDRKRTCYIIGERGTLKWDGINNNVRFFSAKYKVWEELATFESNRDFSFRQELSHFVSCICEDKKPLISVDDGMRVLKLVDAINKSSETKCLCHLT